jgi:hypothetical protein
LQIFFEKDADYDVYKRDYYPLMIRNGFSWKLFPNLKLYLDMQYPEQTQDYIGQNLEHYRPDLPVILAKMITLEEWLDVGNSEVGYWQMAQTKPSSLVHEIGHHIHFTYFGEDNSLIWQKAAALTGIDLDFAPGKAGRYAYKPAYEAIANYFEDCIEGRKENEAFLQFIRELIGVEFIKVTEAEYRIFDDKTYLPVRSIAEKFKCDVDWDDETREVYIAKF